MEIVIESERAGHLANANWMDLSVSVLECQQLIGKTA